MLSTKKAFTLVELIVVITILAVLGTIAFISLQGYSWDARNTKRTSDLGNIASAITTKSAQGVPLVSFLSSNKMTSNVVTSIALAWSGVAALSASEYNVTSPNYIALWVKEEDFKDPNDKPYPLAITTKIRGKYELAASMEDGAGWFVAKVSWTYNPRAENSSGSIASADNGNKLVVLDNDIAGLFKRWDYVTSNVASSPTWQIRKIALDGVTLTFNSSDDLSSLSGTGKRLVLAAGESKSLINWRDPIATTDDFVVDWGEVLPY